MCERSKRVKMEEELPERDFDLETMEGVIRETNKIKIEKDLPERDFDLETMEGVIRETNKIKIEKDLSERDFDLKAVKRVTRKSPFSGFDKFEVPIYQWRVLNFWAMDWDVGLGFKYGKRSDRFPLMDMDYVGTLLMNCDYQHHVEMGNLEKWTLALDLERTKKRVLEELNSLPYFVCKYVHFSEKALDSQELCFATQRFNPNANHQTLRFPCPRNLSMSTVVELYQNPLADDRYESPYKNMAVGKIENFQTEKKGLHLQQLSPRFGLESANLQIVMQFWNTKLQSDESNLEDKGLTATLHVLNSPNYGKEEFSFVVEITIFSQKDGEKDLVKKILLEGNKMEYPLFLAFFYELDQLLDEDTLYYKIVVKAADI